MQIPNYHIHEEIGKGRLATVYRAVQTSLKRPVAIKLMSPLLQEDSRFGPRLIRESQIVSRLTHPNIIHLYDIGTHEQQHYLVMEYLNGGSLNERIEHGFDIAQLLDIICSIAEALQHAHRQGIVHGDIRPSNILFRHDETPVLTDFGITAALAEHVALTALGSSAVNPLYISPEQARGKPPDRFSDQYSLGIVLYQCLTGQLPYSSNNPLDIGLQHIQEPIPQLQPSNRLFQPILDKLLAKNPKQRYASDEELLEALDALEREYMGGAGAPLMLPPPARPQRTSRTGLAVAAGVAVALLGTGFYFARPQIGELLTAQLQSLQSDSGNDSQTAEESSAAQQQTAAAPEAIKTDELDDTIISRLPAPATEAAAPFDTGEPQLSAIDLSAVAAQTIERDDVTANDVGDTGADDDDDDDDAGNEPFEPELEPIELVSIDTQTDIGEVIDEVYSDQSIEQLLLEAEANLRALRLTTPYDNSALGSYEQVLALDPGNEIAQNGLRRIATSYMALAQEKLEFGQFDLGLMHIERGLSVIPNHNGLLALRKQINNRLSTPVIETGSTQSAQADTDADPDSDLSQPAPESESTGVTLNDNTYQSSRQQGWGSR
jgi:serine/threonine-protein kinase PpkA